MNTQNRKAREVANREQLLLDKALEIVEELGFAQLTMDKLTARSEYSKGTVYNHFSSKEDLLCALCLRCLRIQKTLYAKLAGFEGTTREKILGFFFAYCLFARLNPTLYMIALSVKSPAVMEKSSPKRCQDLTDAEDGVVGMVSKLAENALNSGDLGSLYSENLYQLTFAAWCTGFGTVALLNTVGKNTQSNCMERLDIENTMLFNASILLDGLRWKPYSDEFDYRKTWQKLNTEVFAEELKLLGE